MNFMFQMNKYSKMKENKRLHFYCINFDENRLHLKFEIRSYFLSSFCQKFIVIFCYLHN